MRDLSNTLLQLMGTTREFKYVTPSLKPQKLILTYMDAATTLMKLLQRGQLDYLPETKAHPKVFKRIFCSQVTISVSIILAVIKIGVNPTCYNL